MKKITHEIYKDYQEQPYISPERDLEAWAKSPEKFHYGIIEKRQMKRLPEGVLPGDIIMLWRIHFDNFTNESTIPQYFEYRYGVNSDESIELLKKLGYIEVCSAKDSLDALTMPDLKSILKASKLEVKGKKSELLERIMLNISEEEVAKEFELRKYRILPEGSKVLEKYDDIIQRHGPKKI